MPTAATFPNIRPTLLLDFANAGRLSPLVTFTRASTATYFDETGILRTAANNGPRLDYNPSTLAAQGLLIEEQRTNLLLQSADFTTTWSQTNVTITANTTASPDGGTNGDTLLINAAGATTSQTTQSFSAGSTITVSVFAKKNASNFVRFEVGGLVNCWFDLNTGVEGTNSAGSGNVLFSAKSIQAISNGWYRCVLTVTTTTITTLGVNIFATNADNVSSSINSSIFLWGAQAEVGAFPTSYIPTTTTALTRAADAASVNTLSPWFNSTQGSVYVESSLLGFNSTPAVVSFSDGTDTGNLTQINTSGAGLIRYRVTIGGVAQVNNLSSGVTATANTAFKAAAGYAASDFGISCNGTAAATQASGNVSSPTQLKLLQTGSGGSVFSGHIRRIAYYPRRLSDAELVAITS